MENHNRTSLEDYEGVLKSLLENNANIFKHTEEDDIDADCALLANRLKEACFVTEEIVNNYTLSSEQSEDEKYLKTVCILDNVITEFTQKNDRFKNRQTSDSFKAYFKFENNEVKSIKRNFIQFANFKVNNLVYLVRGNDGYRYAWHYVLIELNKQQMFLMESNTGSIDAADYGIILFSGWGENPPQHQSEEIDEFYTAISNNFFILKETETSNSCCIYYYVLIDSKLQKTFEEQYEIKSISIENIQNYGRILYNSFGLDPPEVIFRKMEKAHFCKDQVNLLEIFEHNNTYIHLAIRNGDLETTVSYINQGFNLNEGDKNGWTSLHYGAYGGNLQIVKCLLENEADLHAIDSVCGRKPMHIAAKDGHLDIVKLFLSLGNTVDDVDKNNWVALHYAAWNGHLAVVEFLIGEGANIHVTDSFNGIKPVHVASREGHTQIVKLFLQCGLDIEDTDIDGHTCLYYAAFYGHLDTAAFLINKSANINTKNKFNNTCLHVAVLSGVIDVVKLFLNNNNQINEPNLSGETPLHYAVDYGDMDIVKLLLEEGANVTTKCNDGETPLDVAKKKKNMKIVSLLETESAKL